MYALTLPFITLPQFLLPPKQPLGRGRWRLWRPTLGRFRTRTPTG